MVEKVEMGHRKRVLDDVRCGGRGRERNRNDEARSGKPEQSKNKKFSLPTREEILEHRDRAVAVWTLCSYAPVHRQRAEKRKQDQYESRDWRECAGSQECDAGLITECGEIIHTGEAHHLPPRMLFVVG